MIWNTKTRFATLVAACLFGAFTAVWLLDFALIKADWCEGGSATCFRDWVGALSGWAAAIAAGLSILYLDRQDRRKRAEERRTSQHAALFAARVLRTNMIALERILADQSPNLQHLGYHLSVINRSLSLDDHQVYRVQQLQLRMQHGLCLELTLTLQSLLSRDRTWDVIKRDGTQQLRTALMELITSLVEFGAPAAEPTP